MAITEGSIFSGFPAIASPLALFLIQVIIILSFTRLLVFAFSPLRQPAVIAEVVAGILLGPSALSRIPSFQAAIFPAESLPRLQLFANVALVLFMFVVGIELDFKVLTANLRKSIAISITGIAIPFGLGAAVALLLNKTYPPDSESDGGFTSFVLFGGTAMSITAFPVLARILSEQGLLATRLGATVMNAAAVDDVVAWTVLALVIAISRATSALSAVWTLLSTVGFLLVMFGMVAPLLHRIALAITRGRKEGAGHDSVPISLFVFVMLLCFASAYTTELLGVHAIFGAFIAGLIMPRHRNMHVQLGHKIEDLVVAIFLPLYFTFSGLRTKFNALDDGTAWGMVVLVITAACVGKFGGCAVVARWTGLNWRESAIIGTFMNAKGLVELIVLNVGLDLGVLSPLVFAIFVFMALVTTFMTVPLVHLIYPPHKIIEDDNALTRAAKAAAVAAAGSLELAEIKVAGDASGSADKPAASTTSAVDGNKGGDQPTGQADGDQAGVSSASRSSAMQAAHVSGVHSIFMATFGPHFSASLVSLAAALLPKQQPPSTSTGSPTIATRNSTNAPLASGSAADHAELCHLLPISDRPSSYLHSMSHSSTVRLPASVFFDETSPGGTASTIPSNVPVATAGDSVIISADVPSDNSAVVADVESDVALLLGIERARQLALIPKLTLSRVHAADAATAILQGASSLPKGPADLILIGFDASSVLSQPSASLASSASLSSPSRSRASVYAAETSDKPSSGGVGGRFLDAIVDRFVPTSHHNEDVIRSLMVSAPSTARLGILVGPTSTSTFFGSPTVSRALMVVTNLLVDQGLLQTVGASLAANGTSLEVLLVTDIPSAGVEKGQRHQSLAQDPASTRTSTADTAVGSVASDSDVAVGPGQRTLDENSRLLAQKAAIARALCGSLASATKVQETAAGVHVAHHSALDVAIRTLHADARGLYGRGFDLIVTSASADKVEISSLQPSSNDAPASAVTIDVPTPPIALPSIASSPAAAAFPEITAPAGDATASGDDSAIARSRSASQRARASTLASMFNRDGAGSTVGGDSPSAAVSSLLGTTANRILGSGVRCNLLVCVSGQ